MRHLDAQAIEDIAVGAAVLGTGGGGDPYIGKLMALQALETYGPITLIHPNELDEEGVVIPAAMMGAPTVLVEKIPGTRELMATFELMKESLSQPVVATMPIEVGGVNSMIPLVVAAQTGLPVVDADAMGRAFPEAQMVTFHLDGISPAPVAMADEKGNRMLLYPQDSIWSECFARSITIQMGGSATAFDFPVQGRQVKKSAISGTLTLAERIGRLLREKQGKGSPIPDLLQELGGWELFSGKVSDMDRRTVGGFAKGKACFAGMDDWQGRELEIRFQNEYLIALEDGRPLAMTPDLIIVLDRETGLPITTEGLKYGARVVVIALSCHPKWRTEKGIATVGPRYFGYDVDYIPVEQLVEKVSRPS